jgi:hypothetical protein
MLAAWGRAVLVLVGLFCLLVFAPRLQPEIPPPLLPLLLEDPACAMPCWAGIRPGITRLPEAVTILDRHPWVGQITIDAALATPSRAGLVMWQWNGQQPAGLDASRPAWMSSEGNIVRSLTIPTTLPAGTVTRYLEQHPQPYTVFSAVYASGPARLTYDCQLWIPGALWLPVSVMVNMPPPPEQANPPVYYMNLSSVIAFRPEGCRP